MESVDKTLIVYDVYEKNTENLLVNLQTISAGLIFSDLKIEGYV